jgi:integrin-linked kinase-associated serine/threonine phosphatase 2C
MSNTESPRKSGNPEDDDTVVLSDSTSSPVPRKIRSESSTHRPDDLNMSTPSHQLNSAFAALSNEAVCKMIEFGVTSEQGTRKTMEDQHTALCGADAAPNTPSGESVAALNIPFFGVYDGHGGKQCAEFLREKLHGYILGHDAVVSDTELAVKESVARVENDFMERCRAERIESGSTCALALIVNGQLVTGNVGDSEIVLSRAGEVVLLSTKHQLSNPSEVERVKECGGRIYHSRVGHPKFNPQLVSLAVSRAIGDAGFKLDEYTDGKSSGVIADASTCTTALHDEDEFFVIGCDGLWDVMTYTDCVEFCTKLLQAEGDTTSQSISEALVTEALQRGSTDNVTVLFVDLKSSQRRKSVE